MYTFTMLTKQTIDLKLVICKDISKQSRKLIYMTGIQK